MCAPRLKGFWNKKTSKRRLVCRRDSLLGERLACICKSRGGDGGHTKRRSLSDQKDAPKIGARTHDFFCVLNMSTAGTRAQNPFGLPLALVHPLTHNGKKNKTNNKKKQRVCTLGLKKLSRGGALWMHGKQCCCATVVQPTKEVGPCATLCGQTGCH